MNHPQRDSYPGGWSSLGIAAATELQIAEYCHEVVDGGLRYRLPSIDELLSRVGIR